jgi:hypothetical protein
MEKLTGISGPQECEATGQAASKQHTCGGALDSAKTTLLFLLWRTEEGETELCS